MTGPGAVLLDIVVRHAGEVVTRFSAAADPQNARELRQVLVDAIRRRGADEMRIAEYEMELRRVGTDALIMTFVATHRPTL